MEFLDMSKPTSAKQKETYEASLKRAEEKLENIKGLGHRLDPKHEKQMRMPWERAGLLLPLMKENEVIQSSVLSSLTSIFRTVLTRFQAYVVHSAYKVRMVVSS